MSGLRAPKPWCLGEEETITTFEAWKGNLLFNLSLTDMFSDFLVTGAKWSVKTVSNPNRGYEDDPKAKESPPIGLTAVKKTHNLEILLGQIANYCPVISRSTIVKKSVSLEDIWQKIRIHYGIQRTGGHFLELDNVTHDRGDKPEPLYQRLLCFIEDNLLTKDGGITHHDHAIEKDEELTPSLENIIVLMWLRLIHPGLPRLVKQKYGTILRTKTLASIKDEISQTMESLLDELKCSDEARIMRTSFKPRSQEFNRQRFKQTSRGQKSNQAQGFSRVPRSRSCPLCTEAKRPNGHFLSSCTYLPEADRQYLSRVRQLTDFTSSPWDLPDTDLDHENVPYDKDEDSGDTCFRTNMVSVRKINIKQSPFFRAFYRQYPVNITIDTGAETSMIRSS